MHRFVLLAILILSAFANATSVDDVLCEADALKPGPAAVRLLMAGHKFELLDHTELTRLENTRTWDNPFTRHRMHPNGLALFKGFRQLLRAMTEYDIEQARKYLGKSIAQLSSDQYKIEAAQDLTKRVLNGAEIFRTLELPEVIQRKWELQGGEEAAPTGTLDGRPIFVTRFNGISPVEKIEVLFDPFHPEASQRTRILQRGLWVDGLVQRIYQIDGDPYLLTESNDYLVNLRDSSQISKRAVGLESLGKLSMVKSFSLETKSGMKLISLEEVQTGNGLFRLHIFHPGKQHTPKKSFDQFDCSTYSVHHVADRDLLTCIDKAKKLLLVFDLDTERLLTDFPIDEPATLGLAQHSFFFTENGRIVIGLLSQQTDNIFKIERMDLATRKDRRAIGQTDYPRELTVFSRSGKNFFYARARSEVAIGETDDNQVSHRKLDNEIILKSGFFDWNEEKYEFWNMRDGEVRLINLATSEATIKYKLPDSSVTSIIFAHGRDLYGFFTPAHGMPVILRFTNEEKL